MKKRVISFLLLVETIAMVLGGCGKSDKNNMEPSQQPISTEEAPNMQTQETNTTKEDTRIVRDSVGSIEIPKNPKRIVDLTGNSDILGILGYSVIEIENANDVEAIKSQNPDLILISIAQEELYAKLLEIAPTVMLRFDPLDWEDNVEDIARIFEKEREMEIWLENYEEKAEEAGRKVKEKNGVNATYLAMIVDEGEMFVFSEAGLGDVIYEDMDLEAPIGLTEKRNEALTVISYEELAALKADYMLVLATEEDMKKLETSKDWKAISAVKEGKVLVLEPSPYYDYGYTATGREILVDKILELQKIS